jgi:hypothetical protein
MALTVDYLYTFARKLIKKNQAGGLSSTDFEVNWNDAQASYQDDLLGRFQARSNGKSGQNTGLIENETILTKLLPFTVPLTALAVASGLATKPSGLIFTLALRIGGKMVEKINQNQIYSVVNSVIDPPSVADEKYYYAEYLSYYKLFPDTVTAVDVDYIKSVTNVVWGYTLDSDGRQVYALGSSVQPQWDDNSCREITKRMLVNLGVGLKDKDFEAFGKSVQLTGE